MDDTTTQPVLSDSKYNYLRYIVEIILPGAGTLYFTLATIWGLPYGEQVVGTLAAVALFSGLLIKISRTKYNRSDARFDGALNVDDTADEEFRLEFKKELPELANQDTVMLRVNKLSH